MEPATIRVSPEQLLTPRKTAAYAPTVYSGEYAARAIDDKPWFNYRDIDRMKRDPQIQFCLRILRAPIHQAQWTVEAPNHRIGKLIDDTIHTFWDGYLRQILDTQFTWGYVPGEMTYRSSNGQGILDRFTPIHPMDSRPLEVPAFGGGKVFCGIRVKGMTTDLTGHSLPNQINITTPHAFWHAGEAEYGSYYARPRLADAFSPWSEKSAKGGAVESRRLWFKKCAYGGGILRHPSGSTEYVLADGSTVVIENKQLAREILERFETGGILTLPNTVDPTTGNYLWEYIPPASNGEATGILEYPKVLDEEIFKSFGIPPEIITAAETGSGYAGRVVPSMFFLASEDEVVSALLKTIEVQACRPLVAINYGEKYTRQFKIKGKPLAEILDSKAQKTESSPAPQGAMSAAFNQQQQSPQQRQLTPPKPAESPINMSFAAIQNSDRVVGELLKVLDVSAIPTT